MTNKDNLKTELKELESDKIISKYQIETTQKTYSDRLLNGLGDEIINSFTEVPKIKKTIKLKYKFKYIIKKIFNLF